MPDAFEIATFRFEMISPLLDESLSAADRTRLLRERTAMAFERPQAAADRRRRNTPRKQRASRSTLLRWLAAYRADGFPGLLPRPRSDRGTARVERAQITAYALGLLWEAPDRSLTQLLRYLELEFPGVRLSRSTVNRDLNAHPAYRGITERRRGRASKPRDLYVTLHPHQCWQLDGKGPFTVRLVTGVRHQVRVLSILDDYTRALLAAVIALAEDAAGAVRVFRIAAGRYGLPARMQFDRGSAFDSQTFRTGLALLGSHRNWVEARNPEAQGKIEAYHKSLTRYFVMELRHQEVVDLGHLEALLVASLELVYNQRPHRSIGKTPRDALQGKVCDRRVSTDDLSRIFWVDDEKVSERKTGQLVLPTGSFRVPSRYAGHRNKVRYDPVEAQAHLVLPNGDLLALEPFHKKVAFAGNRPEPHGTGQLQKLLDRFQGRERPNAQPAFGLPEVFRELQQLVGHLVPQDEREARAIEDFYRQHGPLPRQPFLDAIAKTLAALGNDRPLKTYLNHLARLCAADKKQEPEVP